MAHIIYICHRNRSNVNFNNAVFKKLSRHLTPDHIPATEHTILSENGILLSIISYNQAVQVNECSVALGNLESSVDWWKPNATIPDGTYALFRGDSELIELVTDVVASRTIWYFHTDELFLASTSQRAIVACLGSYDPNPKAFPWILSRGCLGPDLSWDRRIKKMRGDSQVILNRKRWHLSERIRPAKFEVAELSDLEHKRCLEDALYKNFENLHLEWSRWVLALSGGYDSRYSMMKLIEKGVDIKCITWCQKESMNSKQSDAYIATQLTSAYGLQHEHFFVDTVKEPMDQLLDRYILNMEGRIDHIRANVDGFARYKQMQESGIIGLIRSDESFGHGAVFSEDHARQNAGLDTLSDFAFAKATGLDEIEAQEIPNYLYKRDGETFLAYRDRLQQEFRLPCMNAALADSKLFYMEQSNPLISRRVIDVVRGLPDHLRINKSLFRKMVHNLVHDIPIATTGNTLRINNLLAADHAKDIFIQELITCQSKNLLPNTLLDYCLHHLKKKQADLTSSQNLKLRVGKLLNSHFPKLKVDIRRIQKRPIPWELLAFRCFTISRMNDILQSDTHLLKND